MFQFTHPGGVRQVPTALKSLLPLFQFTHPGGVRLIRLHNSRANSTVSIHAPGRGATHRNFSVSISLTRFNSRTREGCDLVPPRFVLGDQVFQFTHPGGVRLIAGMSTQVLSGSFNSRTREGCDVYKIIPGRPQLLVSIHAPGRGATEFIPTAE